MAKVSRRGKSWQIDYFDPYGKRIRKGGFRTKKKAEDELAKCVSLIAEGRYLDIKNQCNTTLAELTEMYTENFEHQSSFQNAKRKYLKNFIEYFGGNKRLSKIRYVDVETYRNRLRRKTLPRGKPRQDSSVNREMSCLRHLYTKAVEWELIEQSPFDRGKSLLFKENNQRLRYLTESEIPQLLGACPPYLRDIVECAINSGMRRGEILSLKWDQVRNGFIYLRKTKTNESRQIPVNDDLSLLFKRIRRREHLKSEYVFTYRDKRLYEFKKSFKTALRRAGLEDFRFHDLRHTFASQLIMRGGSLKDVQELLGHKTMTMTLRYAHLSSKHKRKAVNLLNGLTVTKLSQLPIQGKTASQTII
jgi:integrase